MVPRFDVRHLVKEATTKVCYKDKKIYWTWPMKLLNSNFTMFQSDLKTSFGVS